MIHMPRRARAFATMLTVTLALAGCVANTDSTTRPATTSSSPTQESSASFATASGQVADGTITVNARSEVKVVPDKASMGVGIDTEAADAETAQAQNTELVNAVIARLKELGVDEKSIQTSWTNLSPVWDYDSGEGSIKGYSINTRLQVRDLDIAEVGRIMKECVAVGATSVDGPQFYASAYDEAYQEALSAAVAAARPKAEAIAQASGVSLGSIAGVIEGYQDYSIAYSTTSFDAGTGEEAAMDIAPGELSVEASVTVSFAIV